MKTKTKIKVAIALDLIIYTAIGFVLYHFFQVTGVYIAIGIYVAYVCAATQLFRAQISTVL